MLENVTLFDLEPDLAEVERACRLAHVHDERPWLLVLDEATAHLDAAVLGAREISIG